MGDTTKDIKIPYPTEGIIRTAQINDTVCPENSVQLGVNVNFDSIGTITTRKGATSIYPTLDTGGATLALGTLDLLASNTHYIFFQVGTAVYRWTGTNTKSSKRTLTSATNKARFAQFLNRLWMVNGNDGDAPMTSNGGNFDTTDVPATFPKADYISAGFDGRVWIADKSKDIVYYTDIVQTSGGTTYVSPLTFDITTNFISTFSPQNGESITGIFRVPRCLLIFKQNSIYRIFSTTNVDPYPAYNVGTYSQESIVRTKDGVYFHHSTGFYKFNYDGQPTEISRRVIDFVKAISRSNYDNIRGSYDGYDTIKWTVGSVTVEGVTYSNCVLRYTISTQVWTVYDYMLPITAMVTYDSGTTISELAGMTTGVSSGALAILDSGALDISIRPYFEIIDRWRSFTAMYAKAKSISGMMVMSENGGGAAIEYQTEKSAPNQWYSLGKLDEKYDTLLPSASTKDFNNIRLKIKGFCGANPILIYGVEILSIQDKGLNQN